MAGWSNMQHATLVLDCVFVCHWFRERGGPQSQQNQRAWQLINIPLPYAAIQTRTPALGLIKILNSKYSKRPIDFRNLVLVLVLDVGRRRHGCMLHVFVFCFLFLFRVKKEKKGNKQKQIKPKPTTSNIKPACLMLSWFS